MMIAVIAATLAAAAAPVSAANENYKETD